MASSAAPAATGPLYDPERLEALDATGLLDTAPEEAFDRFTRLTTQILGVKVSLLSLVDSGRQFLKSSAGLGEPWASERELPLSHSFAKLVVAGGEPLVIEDVREDERVKDSPDIGDLGIVAYAAFPLRTTAGGHVLGSLCAIDDAPHTWTDEELELLNGFSDAVMAHIELREAEARAGALAEENVRYRHLVDGAGDHAMFMIDLKGEITSWNAGAEHIFGYAPEEAVGQPAAIIFTEEDRAQDIPAYEMDTVREEGQAPDERWHVRKNGARFWASGVMTAIRDEGGALYGFAKVVRDLTERKEYEAALQQAKEEAETAQQEAETAQQEAETAQQEAEQAQADAEAANAAKSRFVANMSHELRTPLNSIIGYSDMFRADPSEWTMDRLADGLGRIHESGHRLLALINDVLDLSKAEAGRLTLSMNTFALADLVDQVADEVRPIMEKNENGFEAHLPDDAGQLCTDRSKVRQILSNLLSNAAKYTHAGTVTLTADLRETQAQTLPDEQKDLENEHCPPQTQRRELVIEVADTGIGMTAKEQETIFDAFERAEETGNAGGTGLGLGIVQNLSSLLGGSVEMESEKGVGSTFTVRLPMKTYPEGQTSEEEARPSVQVPTSPARAPSPRKHDLVLVIDNERDARILMRNYLSEAGYQVETASTGTEGLEQAHELHPTAIILDVMMDEMDGWEVLQRLKEDSDLRSIPVCMITIVDSEERGIQLGAAEYLVKPVGRDRLIGLLEKYRSEPAPFSVLVIDDDKAVRDVTRQVIEDEAGQEVHAAKSGREALDRLAEGLAPNLVLLDLLMPEMDGFAFLNASHEHLRGVPVVVLTAKDLTDEDLHRLEGQAESIIQKEGHPREDLLREVKEGVERLRKKTRRERSERAEA